MQLGKFINLTEDNGNNSSMRRNSSQENEIRHMPESRCNRNFSGDKETLTREKNLWISQEISHFLNGVNSQMENNFSTAILERVIPQMKGC